MLIYVKAKCCIFIYVHQRYIVSIFQVHDLTNKFTGRHQKKFGGKNQLFLKFCFQPQRGMKKIRTNRKQLSIQRNILPKQPMVTVLRPSGQQPLSIPVCPQMGLVSVPNNVRLQPKTITTTGQHYTQSLC